MRLPTFIGLIATLVPLLATEPATAAPADATVQPAPAPAAAPVVPPTPVVRTAPAELIGQYWHFREPDTKKGETEREWTEPAFAISKTAITIIEKIEAKEMGGTTTQLPGDKRKGATVGQAGSSHVLDPRIYRLVEVKPPEAGAKNAAWVLVTMDDRGNKIAFTVKPKGKDGMSASWQSRGKERSANGTRKP
jgi:hypothetical protein